MNSKKSKTSSAAITFYVLSVVLLAIFAFNIYYAYTNVATYLESYQMSFGDQWQMFLSSYFQQCIPSFVGAILCYGIAAILVKLENTNMALLACMDESNNDAYENHLAAKEEKKAKKAAKAKKEEANKVEEVKEEVKASEQVEEVKTETKEETKEEVKVEEKKA